MAQVFISYHTTPETLELVRKIANGLENIGISCWYAHRDMPPGNNFAHDVPEQIRSCKIFLLILDKGAVNSKHVDNELGLAFGRFNRNEPITILPYQVEDCTLSDSMKYYLVHIQIIKSSTLGDITALIHHIETILNGSGSNLLRLTPDFNIRHHEIDNDYYVTPEEITYIKTCRSTVLVGGKNSLHNRITWFPDEAIGLTSLTKGVKIEVLSLPDTNCNYNVVFDHILQKGEEVEYRIQARLTNKNRHFKNFFSTEIIVPIDLLSINLNLSDDSVSHVFTQKLSSSPMNVRTEAPIKRPFQSPFHWHIPNPEVNFEYKIYW